MPKVQKTGIAETIDTDLIIMKKLAEKLNGNDELRKFNLPGIMEPSTIQCTLKSIMSMS